MDSVYEMLESRYEEELRLHPVPLMLDDIPISFEAITPQWLSLVLCADTPGAKVTGLTLGSSDEGTSNRRRIHIEYNANGRLANLPATVFCKSTHGVKNRYQLGYNGFAEGEVLFYRKHPANTAT